MKLTDARKARDVSREELAVAAGVSYATIINFESGRSVPRIDTARLIADFLDVSVDDIEWGAKPASGDDTKEDRTAVA